MIIDKAKIDGAKKEDKSHLGEYWLYYLFILVETIFILFYALFTNYGPGGEPKNFSAVNNDLSQEAIKQYYPMFQDVHVMIFVGFGFLMTFLRSHSWTSVSVNFFLGGYVIQLSILSIGFWRAVFNQNWVDRIGIGVPQIIEADFAAASILIAFGGVLGKLSFLQYVTMATIQTIFYSLCYIIASVSFVANDIGGSMTIHAFGAYFGLTVALVTKHKDADGHPEMTPSYNSNIFGMVGTVFLWMFWPSFNGALSNGIAQHRCVINTYLSLTGSCVMVFLLTPFYRNGKLHMENVLNATLAGGVIIGSSADIIIFPWLSFFIGCCAGTISLLGFETIAPFLTKRIGLQDTCGINNLHGMPGFLGGIISAAIAGTATYEYLGNSLYDLYPTIKMDGSGRSAGLQGCYQLAALTMVTSVAILTGLITGLILKFPCFDKLECMFDDKALWEMEHENEVEPGKKKKNDDYEMALQTDKNVVVNSEKKKQENDCNISKTEKNYVNYKNLHRRGSTDVLDNQILTTENEQLRIN